MSLETVIRSESKLLLPTYDRQRVLFERGRGVYLWDSKGKRYGRVWAGCASCRRRRPTLCRSFISPGWMVARR